MKNKNLKAMLTPFISILALAIGYYFNLDDLNISNIETALGVILGAVFTILGAMGIIKNNDKEEK